MLAKTKTPAEKGNTEKTFFRHPFELPADLIKNYDIRQALVIGYDHVSALRIRILKALDMDFPEGIKADDRTRPPVTLPVQELPLFIKGKTERQEYQLNHIENGQKENAGYPKK